MFIFILSFVLAYVLNLYLTIFGKQDLQALKIGVSLRTYLNDIDESLKAMIGERYTVITKIVMVVLAVAFVVFNAFAFLLCLLAAVLGTYVAKKSYSFSFVNNWLNKLATYINRLR